mgnify:CR=1 FL=1
MIQSLEEAIDAKNPGRIERAMVLYTANVSNNHDLLLEKAEQTMKALSVRKGSHGNDTTCEL